VPLARKGLTSGIITVDSPGRVWHVYGPLLPYPERGVGDSALVVAGRWPRGATLG